MSDFLARARALAGLSRRELAARAGVAPSTVVRIESGQMVPTVAMLDRLLGAAGYRLESRLVPVDDAEVIAPSPSTVEPRSGEVDYTGAAGREISRPPLNVNDLAGPERGVVVLPLHLYWSDGQNRFDLGDDAEVRLLYQTLLEEASPEDLKRFVHGPTLIRIWADLWLPAEVRRVWQPWIEGRSVVTDNARDFDVGEAEAHGILIVTCRQFAARLAVADAAAMVRQIERLPPDRFERYVGRLWLQFPEAMATLEPWLA